MKTFVLLKQKRVFELPTGSDDAGVQSSRDLVQHFLREFTEEGDVVFDPFAGYGTTLLVAEEMGRAAYGIEFDRQRVEYVRALLKHPENLIHGDARRLTTYDLPPFDFSFTSPPYMGEHDRENPFTNYTSEGDYSAYLQDLRSICYQMGQTMKAGARVVLEVSNLKLWDGLTTLAWDVAEAVSQVLRFEGEVVVGLDDYGFGYDHCYCLVFAQPAQEMDLRLAVALSRTDADCQVRLLDSGGRVDARHSEPMTEHNILVEPGELVAVDAGAEPVQIVYRWPSIKVKEDQILGEDGNPVDLDRLRTETFPGIQEMYQRMAAAERVDPKRMVEEGYDRIAERLGRIEENEGQAEVRARYTSALLDGLPAGAEVLELGCGSGLPTAKVLAQHFKLTGVDISAQWIALARQNVPEAHFIKADMTQLDFSPGSFDGIAAFYSIIHVPREEQPRLLQDIASWLRPGGLLVATMGARPMKADIDDYLGEPMYWSSFDGQTNLQIVEEAGLHFISAREETQEEHGQPVTFLWVVAQKPD